jgi:hypothetical protein
VISDIRHEVDENYVITQRVAVVSYRRFGTTYQSLILEDGADRLSLNDGKKLTLLVE